MRQVQNPILPGFHPDPSLLRVGSDYYLATSTFEWFPGVEIHHSTDLVHWELIARPLNRASQLDMRGVPNSGGVWAPCLSYDKGMFYLVYSITRTFDEVTQDTENYLVTATDIRGEWSERIPLHGGGFDPSMFHAPDGSKWIVGMRWDSRCEQNHFPGIYLWRYDPAQKRLTSRGKRIFEGSPIGLAEGPHLYYHNGLYYLLLAEGGTSTGHAVTVCRSAQLEGPYEIDPNNPMLTSRDDPDAEIECAGHGSLVESVDGEWYIAHLGARRKPFGGYSVLGRETFLQNVGWTEDGWLRLKRGGHHPYSFADVPDGDSGQADVFRRFAFDAPGLDLHLASLRIPWTDFASLTEHPGWLRIHGQQSILSHDRQSMIGTQVTAVEMAAETRLRFSPDDFQQAAGIALWYHTANFYYLAVTYDDALGRCIRLTGRDSKKTSLMCAPIPIPAGGDVSLLAEMTAERARFAYRVGDGAWERIQTERPLPVYILSDEYANRCGEQGFTGGFVTLCVQDQTGLRQFADFKMLNISGKSFLPMKGEWMMDAQTIARLANERRADAITMIQRANTGHIGGALSVLDVLSVLFYDVMNLRAADPRWADRDRFLLSKGHSVEGYLALLADLGFFPKAELRTFSEAGSRLIGHPSNKVPGVELCTGALGHGLPVGVGMALAAKRTHKSWRTFVVMGDGEQGEGSIWEAAMAGANYKLDNLFAIIDRNGLQISGTTEEVMALENFADKWAAFGWEVTEIDGHDVQALLDYFHGAKPSGKPHCLICRTVKAKGLPFAENIKEWHHKVPTAEQVREGYQALGVEGVSWA